MVIFGKMMIQVNNDSLYDFRVRTEQKLFYFYIKTLDSLYNDEKFNNIIELTVNGENVGQFQRFPKNLDTLNCYDCNLTQLNNLPETLECLDCCNNLIEKLEDLPKKLLFLSCDENVIITNSLSNLPPQNRIICAVKKNQNKVKCNDIDLETKLNNYIDKVITQKMNIISTKLTDEIKRYPGIGSLPPTAPIPNFGSLPNNLHYGLARVSHQILLLD